MAIAAETGFDCERAIAASRTVMVTEAEAPGPTNTQKIAGWLIVASEAPTRPVGIRHLLDCRCTGVDGGTDGS